MYRNEFTTTKTSDVPVDEEFEKQTAMEAPPTSFKTKIGRTRAKRKKREIRVFVSSTFRDFAKEREEIIKKAFREINRICTDRGVFFTYVDLRWGITSEQTNDGKTIAICLQEIDRCRPYFICLMGERFGWSQRSEKKDEVLNMTFDFAIDNNPNMKWIGKFRYDSSVTQLEIFHGVLNDPKSTANKGFFYMRDPVKPDSVTPAEYKKLVAESDWHRERQEWLRAEVRKHGADVNIKTFQTADQVAELIKEDLERCVDEDFPKGTELTKLEQQREAHNAFAEARCRVYIGRQQYFTAINDNREKARNQPFVLLGESGSGKSALVANWAKRTETADPNTFMFVHFIGSSADSANYLKLIRRASYTTSYLGKSFLGKDGRVNLIEHGVSEVIGRGRDKMNVTLELGEKEVLVRDTEGNQVVQYLYTEISACGRRTDMLKHFAFIAGETYCSLAEKFYCHVFEASTEEEAKLILCTIAQGFNRTHLMT